MDERSLFIAAVQIDDAAERAAYLGDVCQGNADLRQRVEALLAAHLQAGSFLGTPAAPELRATADAPSTERPGMVIGPYKLLEQIGEGGFGIVFMAEQTRPVRRKVALKMLKPGMDTRQVVARFEGERQALALMDHPNIAKVLDAGETAGGRPYFVMDLVKGIPITEYCNQSQLTPRERLELFSHVCQAIQHAHQKGIIHRDIKPSNVLVTLHDGEPLVKVIDFGVAKALGQQLTEKTLFTGFAQLVGTPLYMSPEQAAMSNVDVDTRSDIYSLGVLLYELLTGTTPFDNERLTRAGYDEMRRIIREEEPPKPSTRVSTLGQVAGAVSTQRKSDPKRLSQLFRGELDWIVMKCLEKDRNRRYETANGLALDLHRYLHDEPVLACPPSAAYRFRKFARRNKAPVLTAVLVMLALIGGVIATTWQMLRATQAEADATREAREKSAALAMATANENHAKAAQRDAQENLRYALAAVDQMLTRVAQDKLLYVPQMEPIRRDLLQDAVKFYEMFLESRSDDPFLRRDALLAQRRLAGIYWQLRQFPNQEKACQKAFDMFDKLDPAAAVDNDLYREMVNCHIEYCWMLQALGKRDEAERSSRRAVALADKLDAEPLNRPYLVSARTSLAGIALENLRFDEAEKILNESLVLTDDAASLGRLHGLLASVYLATGRLPRAEQSARSAVEYAEQFAADHPSTNWAQSHLADEKRLLARVIAVSHRVAEASNQQRGAVAILDKLATDFPDGPAFRQSLADAVIEEAGFLRQQGDNAGAETAYRRAIRLYQKLAADFPTDSSLHLGLGQSLWHLADVLSSAETHDEALNAQTAKTAKELAEEALAEYSKAIELDPRYLSAWINRAVAHRSLKRYDEAFADVSTAIELEPNNSWAWRSHIGFFIDLVLWPEAAAESARAFRIKEADCQFFLGHAILRRYVGDAPGHRDACERMLARFADSTNPDDWSCIARALVLSPEPGVEPSRAVAFAERAVSDSKRADRVAHVGLAHYRAGEFERAVTVLEESLALGTNFNPVDVHSTLAMALQRLGKNEQARQAFDKARAARRERLESMLAASIAFRLDDWSKWNFLFAELFYREAYSLLHGSPAPEDPSILLLRSRGLEAIGRADEARIQFDKAWELLEKMAEEFPQHTRFAHELGRVYNHLGIVLARQNQFPPSEQAHRKALALYERLAAVLSGVEGRWPRQEVVYTFLNLGDLFEKSGRADDALKAWGEARVRSEGLARQYDDNAIFRHWIKESCHKSQGLLMKNERIDEAVAIGREATDFWRKLAAEAPNPAVPWFELARFQNERAWSVASEGVLVFAMEAFREAIAAYAKVIEMEPANALAHNELAWIYATCPSLDLRNPPQAVALAKKAVELTPSDGNHWNTLGAAQYRAGDYKDAIEPLKKAMELRKGGDAFDFYLLAMTHWRLDQPDEARQWLTRASDWEENNRAALAGNPQWADELRRLRAEAEESLKKPATETTCR